MRKYIFVGLALSIMLFARAYASSYEILFEEGAYKFDPKSKPTDVDNKYLARVSIKKDGVVLAKNIRGSTLPDAWVFYSRWNVELKRTTTPNDADVVSMFEYFEQRSGELRKSDAKTGETRLADIAEIIDVLNRVPALPSGAYSFVTGLHKDGNSIHGKPFAARLLGSTASDPFDPSVANSKATRVGGFIRTLNRNNAQGQKKIASGINVHDGRIGKNYRDSEGCLTIRPQDWKLFYSALPSPENWVKDKHTGRVVVVR